MADINLGDANGMILDQITDKTVLANTIKVMTADGDGRRFESVNMYVDVLADVTVRTYTEADRANDVDFVFDQLSWTPITITLSDEVYVGLEISGVDNLLINAENISDLDPYMNSLSSTVARHLEASTAASINGLTGANVITEEYTGVTKAEKGEEVISALQDLALDFEGNGVETENRFAVLGRNTYKNLIATKELLHADKAGEDTSLALRKATVGEIAGFTIIASDKVDANSLIAYQSNAFGLASKSPAPNVSAPYSVETTAPGAPLKVLVSVLGLGARNKTGILVETFFGVKELVLPTQTSNPRAKKVVFTDTVA
jgi:hypothetical protein